MNTELTVRNFNHCQNYIIVGDNNARPDGQVGEDDTLLALQSFGPYERGDHVTFEDPLYKSLLASCQPAESESKRLEHLRTVSTSYGVKVTISDQRAERPDSVVIKLVNREDDTTHFEISRNFTKEELSYAVANIIGRDPAHLVRTHFAVSPTAKTRMQQHGYTLQGYELVHAADGPMKVNGRTLSLEGVPFYERTHHAVYLTVDRDHANQIKLFVVQRDGTKLRYTLNLKSRSFAHREEVR